jgi:hypothetical protein
MVDVPETAGAPTRQLQTVRGTQVQSGSVLLAASSWDELQCESAEQGRAALRDSNRCKCDSHCYTFTVAVRCGATCQNAMQG